ncbi:MAG TPA: hypothetical protein VJ483_03730 [Holophagaceae bacterium]|nr:hypothetical protein [Holophagaceae bacterium]
MRRLLLALAVPSLLAQQGMPATTLDQVLEGYYGTLGGLAKLKATKTRRVEGHFEGLGSPVSYVQINERPNHCWLVTTNGPDRRLKLFDGKEGWEVLAAGPRRQLMPEEIADLEPDFDGPLVDAQVKGHRLSFGGLMPLGYGRAYVVRGVLANGETQTIWFDAVTFHRLKQVTKRMVQSNVIETEMLFSDYRDVEGRSMPFKVTVGTPGQAPRYSVVVDSMAFDKPVDVPSMPTK